MFQRLLLHWPWRRVFCTFVFVEGGLAKARDKARSGDKARGVKERERERERERQRERVTERQSDRECLLYTEDMQCMLPWQTWRRSSTCPTVL